MTCKRNGEAIEKETEKEKGPPCKHDVSGEGNGKKGEVLEDGHRIHRWPHNLGFRNPVVLLQVAAQCWYKFSKSQYPGILLCEVVKMLKHYGAVAAQLYW
jgi:hypothetical protein